MNIEVFLPFWGEQIVSPGREPEALLAGYSDEHISAYVLETARRNIKLLPNALPVTPRNYADLQVTTPDMRFHEACRKRGYGEGEKAAHLCKEEGHVVENRTGNLFAKANLELQNANPIALMLQQVEAWLLSTRDQIHCSQVFNQMETFVVLDQKAQEDPEAQAEVTRSCICLQLQLTDNPDRADLVWLALHRLISLRRKVAAANSDLVVDERTDPTLEQCLLMRSINKWFLKNCDIPDLPGGKGGGGGRGASRRGHWDKNGKRISGHIALGGTALDH